MTDELVLVKRVRPRALGRYAKDGAWLLDVQAQAQRDAVAEWAVKEDAPFEVVPPLKVSEWSGPALFVFGRGVYRELRSLIP